jgi:hypothetical protein
MATASDWYRGYVADQKQVVVVLCLVASGQKGA